MKPRFGRFWTHLRKKGPAYVKKTPVMVRTTSSLRRRMIQRVKKKSAGEYIHHIELVCSPEAVDQPPHVALAKPGSEVDGLGKFEEQRARLERDTEIPDIGFIERHSVALLIRVNFLARRRQKKYDHTFSSKGLTQLKLTHPHKDV